MCVWMCVNVSVMDVCECGSVYVCMDVCECECCGVDVCMHVCEWW